LDNQFIYHLDIVYFIPHEKKWNMGIWGGENMKKTILGIVVCMLMITAVVPAMGDLVRNEKKTFFPETSTTMLNGLFDKDPLNWFFPFSVGVEWVNTYHNAPVPKIDLQHRDDAAMGFYNRMITKNPYCKINYNPLNFHWGESFAWEQDFKQTSKGGTDNWIRQGIDTVDFGYFAGHGAGSTGLPRGSAITFSDNQHDNWILESTPTNREPRWGDLNLEWIVLSSCSELAWKDDPPIYPEETPVTLDIYQRWANKEVMNGLHYILGFRTAALDIFGQYEGHILADYLMGEVGGAPSPVRLAWYHTTIDCATSCGSLPQNSAFKAAYLRAWSPGCNTHIDHIPGFGEMSPDPDPDNQYYYWFSWPI
jgi:hypothetical protein